MAPGSTGGKEMYSVQCDEAFVFVLEGSVTISIEDEETVLERKAKIYPGICRNIPDNLKRATHYATR